MGVPDGFLLFAKSVVTQRSTLNSRRGAFHNLTSEAAEPPDTFTAHVGHPTALGFHQDKGKSYTLRTGAFTLQQMSLVGWGFFSIMILQLPDSGFVSAPCLVFDPKEVLLFSLGERRLWGKLRAPTSA